MTANNKTAHEGKKGICTVGICTVLQIGILTAGNCTVLQIGINTVGIGTAGLLTIGHLTIGHLTMIEVNHNGLTYFHSACKIGIVRIG